MMHHVLIAGAGKIGSLIACLLVESGDYQVYLADKHFDGVDIFRLKNTITAIETVRSRCRKPRCIGKNSKR